MEHKLILGGGQYLPFARSRIKALLAAGMVSARQVFVVDGFVIEVRVCGIHHYIRIDGGDNMPLSMDSGIVTGLVEGEGEVAPYLAGIIRETSSVQDYTVGFTPILDNPQWKKKEPDESAGQFIGIVSTPSNGAGKFTGYAPIEGGKARSFSPATRNVAPDGQPPVWEDLPDDAVLLQKKICAALRPASLFTGKCRLYVQALYGLHLYGVKNDKSSAPFGTGQTLEARPSPSVGGYNAISVPSAYKATDPPGSLPNVSVDTSTGVYLDKASGRHWLVKISGVYVTVYPLVCPRSIGLLRRYIKTPLNDAERIVLSVEDKERLEAHILAHSLPYAKAAKTYSIADTALEGEPFGYGWHWNWDGSAADIVLHMNYDQGNFGGTQNYGMESTHYRVNMGFVDGVLHPTLSTISGPTRWGVNRAYWCFAGPDPQSGGAAKKTPRYSQSASGETAFYVFYSRNEINLCTVQVAVVSGAPNSRACTGGMSTRPTTYGAVVECTTNGLLGGECLDTASVPEHPTITVSCGSTVVSGIPIGKSEGFRRWLVSSKSESSPPLRDPTSEAYSASGDFYIPQGYSPYTYVGPWPPASYQGTAIPQVVQYTLVETSESVSTTGYVTCIVPAYDAEAIFLHGESSTRTIKSGTEQSRQGGSYSRVGYAVVGGVMGEFITAWNSSGRVVGGGSDTLLSETPVSSDVSVPFMSKSLVLKPGRFDAVFDDLSEFRNQTLEVTTSNIAATSGARISQPTIISPGHIDPVGTTQTDFVRRALVGWI